MEEERRRGLAETPAEFCDLQKVILSRSRIETWVDEPFFEKTVVGVFVKVGFLKKYIIAEVKGIIEDDDHPYTLTNGKQTNKYLKLLT